MNNFELHKETQTLADTHSKYQLAKMVIEARSLNKQLLEPLIKMTEFAQQQTDPYINDPSCFNQEDYDDIHSAQEMVKQLTKETNNNG